MDEQFAVGLEAIPWFVAVGQPPQVVAAVATVAANGQPDAMTHYSDPMWSDTTLEARNRLTSFLHQWHRDQYGRWNEVTTAAKSRVVMPLAERVWRPFADQRALGKKFVGSVSWNVLAAIMEHEFEDRVGRPTFFLHLLDVYRAGHCPCGWDGEWPDGSLVVW
jgi:hypothetical protein